MRTKEYDVQFNDGRLSIVRLRDGAPVVDSVEIPADAVGASVQVLAAAETARISASESQATKTPVAAEGSNAPPAEESNAPPAEAPKRTKKKKKATE
jgi:hypothetical protein